MLNLALVGLLTSSFALTPPPGPCDDATQDREDCPAVEVAETPGVFDVDLSQDPESITLDTYAMGRPAAEAPIKVWAQYAYGTAADIYLPNNDVTRISIAGSTGDVVSQRVAVGAQVNFLSLPRFAVGAGAQLGIAKNEFNVDNVGPAGVGDLESDFGLQQVKVYGTARGRVLGVHAGYAFDLGSEQEFTEPIPALGGAQLPTNLPNSDGRDAIFVGADFDYPSERFRLMGGIDWYMLQSGGEPVVEDGGDYLNFMFGAGLRFNVFELGAALQIQSRWDEPTLENVGTTSGIGGHVGTVVPYLRISPPSLPASLYIKGATPDEYLEYGAPMGGQNAVQPGLGFTAGLSVGFE